MPPRPYLALGSLALALAGCPGRNITPLPEGFFSPGPVAASPVPSPVPTLAPTPGASATPSATPAPVPSPSAPVLDQDQVLGGRVYDEAGQPVDHATVTIASLDQYNPYFSTVLASQGRWSVDNFPDRVNFRVTATREGWTTRSRVGAFRKGQANLYDFGGPAMPDDLAGPAFFISAYPEIEGTSPAQGAEAPAANVTSYQLALSQPFDATAQAAFADALRVFPANNAAAADDASGGHATSLRGLPPVGEAGSEARLRPIEPVAYVGGEAADVGGLQPWDYALKNNAAFLDDPGTRTTVSWDATGRVATLRFNAPLQASRTQGARYQVGLAAGANPIASYGGKPLGIAGAGELGDGSGPRNFLLHGVFVKGDLAVTPAAAADPAPTRRWLQTHEDVTAFTLLPDAEAPALASVAYAQLPVSSRLALTFTKPLASFNGRVGGRVDRGLATGAVLDGLSFAASDQRGGTQGLALKGGTLPYALVPAAGATGSTLAFGDPSTRADSVNREFRLSPTGDAGAFGQLLAGGPGFGSVPDAVVPYGTSLPAAEAGTNRGRVLLAVNPAEPRTLFVYFVGLRRLFDPSLVELKVRAQDVRDPAGNGIFGSAADQQVATTLLSIAP